MELYKKHISKLKAMDARGKTTLEQSQPHFHLSFANQNAVETPAAHANVPPCSMLSLGPYSLHAPAEG